MFDNIHFHQHRNSGPRHVHEHRAPTDESVRLLNEMREAALANIIARWPAPENTINAEWSVWKDYDRMGLRIFCRYSLNGKVKNFEHFVSEFDMRDDRWARAMFEEFCRDLGREFMGPFIDAMQRESGRYVSRPTTLTGEAIE